MKKFILLFALTNVCYLTSKAQLIFQDSTYNVGIGTTTPLSQLHLASDSDHAFMMTRANATYGFRIFRDAEHGAFLIQIGADASLWETKIRIGEGEGANTKLLLNPDGGNVGIGTKSPQAKLTVNGDLFAKKVKVTLDIWPDYVFEPNYSLPSLQDIESYIQAHKHLPEIPSAAEIEKDGLNVGDMQAKMMQKIEELTLYLIEQNKKLVEQQQLIKDQDLRLKQLEKRLQQ